MQQASARTPAQIVAHLLAVHPEAQSLLGEAGHRETLAGQSAAAEREAFKNEQAARLRYEELRHLVDPRLQRGLHFGAGLLLLAALALGLAMLTGIELRGAVAEPLAAIASAGLTAVWLVGAWLAVLLGREGHHVVVVLICAAGCVLGLLLAALHDLTGPPERPEGWIHAMTGALLGVLIMVLVIAAAVLVEHLEPACVLDARRRWRRMAAVHERAVQRAGDDAELAAVAKQAWLRLLRHHGSGTADVGSVRVAEVVVHLVPAGHEPERSLPGEAIADGEGAGASVGGGGANLSS